MIEQILFISPIYYYFEKNLTNKYINILSRLEIRTMKTRNYEGQSAQDRMREESRFESSSPRVTGVRSLGADHSLSVLRCTCHTASFIAFISLPSSNMPFVIVVHPATLHPVVHTFLYRSYSIIAFIYPKNLFSIIVLILCFAFSPFLH